MDTSRNKHIAMKQNLLSVAGKSTIPPQHIITQQRKQSQSDLAQTRKIIPLEHREPCPLCHCRSFIFAQSKYNSPSAQHSQSQNINQLTPAIPGTFMCSKCSNKHIQMKLFAINKLKREIKQLSQVIQPILCQKVNSKNGKYFDHKLQSKQYQQTISNIRLFIKQKQTENKILKSKCDTLKSENMKRRANLQHITPKITKKWQYVRSEFNKKRQAYITKEKMNESISKQISLSKLLQITDFYQIKVLPTMHSNKHTHLSMIQNIAIPSIFKVKHIKSFYANSDNELFRFPLPHKCKSLTVNVSNINPRSASPYPYHNRSSSSLLKHKSSKYEIALKSQSKSAKSVVSKTIKHKKPSSPLQKYMPRIMTNSISSVSEKIGIPFLTPPGYRRKTVNDNGNTNDTESKSLPKNWDDLILPPSVFAAKSKKSHQKVKVNKTSNDNSEPNKIVGRGRSHSLDTLPTTKSSNNRNRLSLSVHSPHIEHGICAALQYIVSYLLHVSKYLNIELLYRIGLFKKSKKHRKFILHTYIERKGKYFRLYWIGSNETKEFEIALHLLQETINDLCIKCGVKSSKLKYLQFIDNLNTLVCHLQKQKQSSDGSEKSKRTIKNRRANKKPRIEPLHIINNYGSAIDGVHLSREHSTSNSISNSFSESMAINNSESDVVISPHEGDSENEEWDFVDYT